MDQLIPVSNTYEKVLELSQSGKYQEEIEIILGQNKDVSYALVYGLPTILTYEEMVKLLWNPGFDVQVGFLLNENGVKNPNFGIKDLKLFIATQHRQKDIETLLGDKVEDIIEADKVVYVCSVPDQYAGSLYCIIFNKPTGIDYTYKTKIEKELPWLKLSLPTKEEVVFKNPFVQMALNTDDTFRHALSYYLFGDKMRLEFANSILRPFTLEQETIEIWR